jgi:hypothetical protein
LATNATNATQLNGQPASFYTNASSLATGTLANTLTTGTDLNTPSSLVLRDASGNFSAGTITAALNGNATTATSATTATNASQLNGQSASFYTNASNISTGTFAAAQIPGLDASKIVAGTLANARTSGTNLGTPGTLVLRDASGNFSAGTITASLSGNATTATSATTATNATQLNGQSASFYTNASNITTGTLAAAQVPNLDTSKITSGMLDNARTSATSLSTPSTLVQRDASGNFAAGTITASLNGNAASATSASTATTASTATNATQLNGQAASFYTNASNITTGTLAAAQVPNLDAAKITTGSLNTAQIPNLDASKITTGTLATTQVPNLDASKITTGTLADARLSPNIALKNAANVFTSTGATSFAGNIGIGTTTPDTQYSLQAVSGGDTQIALTGGPSTGNAIPPRTWAIQSSSVNSTPSSLNGTFQIIDRTGVASRLLIDTNGNVGIGTSTPTQRLTVAGNMNVTGSLAKGGGSFKIDHPLDPENKYLYHSFVESPDMMNVYNGNITTDAGGYATITMPDYFEALNRDFRYQLTVINEADTGEFLWAQVVRELKNNQFTIRSSRADVKVSWQITGIRHDAWAEKNRIPNSVDKVGSEKGKYLHPEAFDQPTDKGVHQTPVASEH